MPPFSGNRAVLLELALKQTRKMFNSPCGGLKRPYLDPGAQYARNLWDWDSYWASVALLGIAAEVKDDAFSAEVLKHAKGSLLTFFDYQAPDGSMPILLDGEGVDVFETRNPGQNIGKPIHAQFALLLEERGAFDDAEKAMLLRGLRRLAECRINRSRSCPTGLFVWNTDAAIGVDDDPTAWGRPPKSSAHIYLNCLVYADFRAAETLAGRIGDAESVRFFRQEADALGEAVRRCCYDRRDGLYYTVDVQCVTTHPKFSMFTLNASLDAFWQVLPLKIGAWSSFLPLWCGIARQEEAGRMVREHLMNPARFWTPWGIRSLAADEVMYRPDDSRGNPSNWLGPVWIISCYMVWLGLKRYGFEAEALQLAENVVGNLAEDCRRNNVLHEYYSGETGEGISGPGFLNWNLLALLMHP